MNFAVMLEKLLSDADGIFENIPWTTSTRQSLTLGTMTDDHVANCRHYHKHMAEVARVAPEIFVDVEHCKNIEWLMDLVITKRRQADTWTINSADFRLQ